MPTIALVAIAVLSGCPLVVDGRRRDSVATLRPDQHALEVPTISDLVRAARDGGLTYRELEARSQRAGFGVKFQTFEVLANQGPLAWPKSVDTIRGIAAALDITEQAVVLGYAASLGVRVTPQPRLVAGLPPSTALLTEPMRDAILGLIRAATADPASAGPPSSASADPACGVPDGGAWSRSHAAPSGRGHGGRGAADRSHG